MEFKIINRYNEERIINIILNKNDIEKLIKEKVISDFDFISNITIKLE